jgi:hypothetical protein
VVAFICSGTVSGEPARRTLTLDDRVKAQEAIERVYYRHQIGATTPFETAVPRATLEAKVRKYLDQTAALAVSSTTFVTDEMLDRELTHNARSRMPALRELYAALGNDPFVIEGLARATLVIAGAIHVDPAARSTRQLEINRKRPPLSRQQALLPLPVGRSLAHGRVDPHVGTES